MFWNFKKFKNYQIFKIFNKLFLNRTTLEIGEYAISVIPIYNSPNGNSFGFYYDLDGSIFLM